MQKHGNATFTIDNDPQFRPSLCADVLVMSGTKYYKHKDILWASPPCQGFSVAVIGRNWNHDATPKTASARLAMQLAQKTIAIIEASKPKWWFIENPRGMLRKMPWMTEFLVRTGGVRHQISYCQYGDKRMKPTDIWTNALWWKPKKICKNGMPCHVSAPRGAKTGTQGLKGAAERGRIPAAIFEEILKQMPL